MQYARTFWRYTAPNDTWSRVKGLESAMFTWWSNDVQYLNIVYLEPKWPLLLKVNPPKQGLFQPKQGSFRFQVYNIYI